VPQKGQAIPGLPSASSPPEVVVYHFPPNLAPAWEVFAELPTKPPYPPAALILPKEEVPPWLPAAASPPRVPPAQITTEICCHGVTVRVPVFTTPPFPPFPA
jgi:hypothetical protein